MQKKCQIGAKILDEKKYFSGSSVLCSVAHQSCELHQKYGLIKATPDCPCFLQLRELFGGVIDGALRPLKCFSLDDADIRHCCL